MNIISHASLKPYNTFGIDVTARHFAAFNKLEELQEGLLFHSQKYQNLSQPLVLGGGSNILFTENINNLVLKNNLLGKEILSYEDEFVYVKAGAGEPWHGFVEYCIENDFGGVENLSLIPGSVGASPIQNIGAYGVEISDVCHSLQAYHIKDELFVHIKNANCKFGYRDSIFKNKLKNQYVIIAVIFKLRTKPQFNISYGAIQQELNLMNVDELTLKSISQAIINIRKSKLPDPAVIGNAGSFFKNPEVTNNTFQQLKKSFPGIPSFPLPNGNIKLAAGWLIEHCGWKGYRYGDAGCHSKQALVLVNYNNASGTEIFTLSEEIIESVMSEFGVRLEREVNIIGESD